MDAGREMDALIAEKVMGIELPKWIFQEHGLTTKTSREVVPDYSTDIAAAWQVVEKMRSNGYFYEVTENIEDPSIYCAMFVDRSTSYYDTYESGWSNEQWAAASTAPHVICLAALKAVGALAD